MAMRETQWGSWRNVKKRGVCLSQGIGFCMAVPVCMCPLLTESVYRQLSEGIPTSCAGRYFTRTATIVAVVLPVVPVLQ
jgi:cytochrome c biogenesis factor